MLTSSERTILDRTIRESYFRLKPNDAIMLYSDGIVYAGVGEGLAMGWQEDGILDYVSQTAPSLSADPTRIADSVAETALGFWHSRPGDDGTVLCARYRKAEHATVLTGPPMDRTLVGKMLRDFLASKGRRIVCGGTTSHLLADHLGREIEPDERYIDTDLPRSPGWMAPTWSRRAFSPSAARRSIYPGAARRAEPTPPPRCSTSSPQPTASLSWSAPPATPRIKIPACRTRSSFDVPWSRISPNTSKAWARKRNCITTS